MSVQENIQKVQEAYARFSRGEIAAILDALGEDIQWITPGNPPMGGERQGREEVGEFFQTLLTRFEFLAFEPSNYVASGDQVVALGRYEVRSRQTGRMAASHFAMVWTFRDGKPIRFQDFLDTATIEAAEAA